ncbi:hypothetical protein DSO57_1039279 [Entomophthora muscae]|uniref:Uncharacterized protein n=1 Tax=Entomophthora muscae TaxID=34485 RepID=A0ACC2T9G3_9FUNG|nr:hypothetical protein DSO57_1039279 [Entomophthora muscae]
MGSFWSVVSVYSRSKSFLGRALSFALYPFDHIGSHGVLSINRFGNCLILHRKSLQCALARNTGAETVLAFASWPKSTFDGSTWRPAYYRRNKSNSPTSSLPRTKPFQRAKRCWKGSCISKPRLEQAA